MARTGNLNPPDCKFAEVSLQPWRGWGCIAHLERTSGMIDLAANVTGHLSLSRIKRRTRKASLMLTNHTTRNRRGARGIHPGVSQTPLLLVGPSSVHSGLLCRTRTVCEFGPRAGETSPAVGPAVSRSQLVTLCGIERRHRVRIGRGDGPGAREWKRVDLWNVTIVGG